MTPTEGSASGGTEGEVAPDDVVAIAAERAAARVRAVDRSANPFSEAGFDLLQEAISDYVRSLVLESGRIASRQRSDVISATDVDRASQYLYRAPAKSLTQQVGTGGGILLGAALGNALGLLSQDSAKPLEVAITLLLGVVGAFMIALHIARDLR